ncbi:MAG: VOC family protein [Candidatus Binatia bacterium]|nr:VOC family protein [Candidatus Binatia bacterium]
MVKLDHLILMVNDMDASVAFYMEIMGFRDEGSSEPFRVIRVRDDLTLQLAPWGTSGGTHLAFAMERPEFDEAFARIRNAGLEYGDSFHSVGNQQGPGDATGALGPGKAVYVFDPNKHLIEIRHY